MSAAIQRGRLHLFGLPHTITHSRFSTCAFTGKIQRFAPMMRSVGYEVIHYGVEGAATGANEQVDVMPRARWLELGGREPDGRQYGDLIRPEGPLYLEFNYSLGRALAERVQPEDIICLPFGSVHHDGLKNLIPKATRVEIGVGYPAACEQFRVYESYAWMHYHLGREQRPDGSDYWWVIPNSYDPNDWPLGNGAGNYLLYFGRLNRDKGLDVVWEVARARPDLKVVLCGQGDASPWTTLPNIEVRAPLHGDGRAELLGNARAVLMPTRYIEPFGGVAVEAMLCGTPVLASDWGAFAETIIPGQNGYRCHTMRDWLAAVDVSPHMQRPFIQDAAAGRYSMWIVAHQYDRMFRQLADLRGAGWYA